MDVGTIRHLADVEFNPWLCYRHAERSIGHGVTLLNPMNDVVHRDAEFEEGFGDELPEVDDLYVSLTVLAYQPENLGFSGVHRRYLHVCRR
ncbi:hypothetical protein [Pseudomonas phage vB_PseudoP-SA22]|nr:hypothetical protein [Pseudomonas phage vB_PseudoP-SA22]